MWIIPKQLHTSAFVPDTAALSLDSTELSEICARSLFVRSKPSPARTWSQKWKRDSWTQHLSGRILNPSHGQSFVTAWTSSLGDIPASPSAQPESASAPMTPATSGHTSPDQYELFDLDYASLRMSKDTSALDSEKSLESWNQSVIKARGEYSLRLKSAHRTKESECSSWPTIRASEYKDTGPIGSKSHDHMLGKGYLCAVVTQDAANWPTPDASNHRDGAVLRTDNNLEQGGFHGVSLHHAMTKYGQAAPAKPSTDGSRQESWVTPRSADARNPGLTNCKPGSMLHLGTQAARQEKSWLTPRANEPDSDSNFVARNAVHGLPAPANHNTHGNRQGLSEQSQRNWQTFAPGTHNRGETPHRQVVKALVNREKAQTQCLTVDQVFAKEIKGTNRQESWATPIMGDSHLASTPEVAQKRIEEGKVTLSRQNPGKLNPRWVETLMGLPVGWVMPSCASPVTIEPTNCASSATESCQQQQNEHSELFGRNSND
jgi:hypothetical protein